MDKENLTKPQYIHNHNISLSEGLSDLQVSLEKLEALIFNTDQELTDMIIDSLYLKRYKPMKFNGKDIT